MKRFIALAISIVMIFALVGCNSNTEPNNEDTQNIQGSNSQTQDTQGTTENTNTGTFPGEVTESVVRNYKVAEEKDFTCAEIAGGVRISAYLGNDTIVVLPKSIGGKTVVAIDGYIFANESQVRGIYVPETVTTLTGTFPNNNNLEVVICEGVEKIIDGAFLNCANLHTVVLGNSLNELGERAFAGCKALKELYIAPSLTAIDSSLARMVFYKCESLTIKGEANSYIETFCTEQGINFAAE